MIRRHARALTMLGIAICAGLLCPVSAPSTVSGAAPTGPRDVISGRWLVSHHCLAFCTGGRQFVEVVHHRAGNVYVGVGGEAQVLYLLGTQVLVHAPKDSVLLTLRQPGLLMSGVGVEADGATINVTWRCLTPHAAAPQATVSSVGADRSSSISRAFEVC